jgi:uridine kinase
MTKFIAVDGHGGSGKSTLAKALAEKIGGEIIHTDDFASFDNPINWWPLVIERVFDPIKNGAKVLNYPRSKWWVEHNPEPVIDQPVTDYIILEGVSSLRKEFRQYLDFGIFVDTPKDVCLKRGVARDKGNDGKTDDEIATMWNEWLRDEDAYMSRDDPKGYADYVVNGTSDINSQLQGIVEAIQSHSNRQG